MAIKRPRSLTEFEKKLYNDGFKDGVKDTQMRIDTLRADTIKGLISAIDEQGYCLLEEWPYYKNCGFHSCPIDSKAEVIIQTWLKKIAEQLKEKKND